MNVRKYRRCDAVLSFDGLDPTRVTRKVGVLEFILQKGNSQHALAAGNCMPLVRFVQWPEETEFVLMPREC